MFCHLLRCCGCEVMGLACAVNGSCPCCVRTRVHAPCVSVVMCFYARARVCVCALWLLCWRQIFSGSNDRMPSVDANLRARRLGLSRCLENHLYFRHYAKAHSAPGIILVPAWSRLVFASLTNRRSISSRSSSRTPLSPQFLPAMV